MGRYIRLIGKLFRYSIILEMQYRANFLIMLPVHLAWTLQEVFTVLIIYLYTDNVWGWSKYEIILLVGTYFIVDSLLTSVVFPNINALSEKIRTGQLDFFILKPIDSQFLVLTYKINLSLIYAFAVGVVLVCIALNNLNAVVITPINFVMYLLLLINGFLIFAFILYMIASLAFWTVQIDYVRDIFVTFAQFARKPFEIYPKLLRQIVIYIIPLAFIAYVPAGLLLGKLSPLWCSISFVFTPILFILSRKMWHFSLKAYESVSS
jgi:ABC-2 type transport system permease protein